MQNLLIHERVLFKVIFFFVFLFSYFQTFASFTLSGSIITQTGVDTSLSGLSSISGVTVVNEPRGAGLFKKVYYLSNRTLVINGTLTIDATKEKLVFEENCPATRFTMGSSSASLTIVSQKSPMGNTVYMEEEAILFLRTDFYNYSNAYTSNSLGDMYIQKGNFTWNGGIIRFSAGVGISVGTIDKGSLISYGNGATTPDNGDPASDLTTSGQIFFGGNLVVNDLKVGNGNYVNITSTDVAINGIEFEGMMRGAEANIDNVVIENYNSRNGVSDIGVFDGYKMILRNPIKGTNLKVGGHVYNASNNTHFLNKGAVKVVKEVQFTGIKDVNGNNVDATFYFRDYNNGNRAAYSSYAPGRSNTPDFPEGNLDLTYTGNIINGESSIFEVVTGLMKQNANGGGNSDYPWDYRSKNGNSDDVFDVQLVGYHYLPVVITTALKGAGLQEIDWTLFDDPSITEANKATVDAYTEIDNLDKLYDRAKSWKIDNVGLEYPAVDEQLITANGIELDLGNRSLVIDATAASAFAVNTGTNIITIKASALEEGSTFSKIKTTGTVSVQNSALLKTGYIDTTGSFIYMELSNLDQQDILVTDQQNPSSPVTLLNIPSTTGTYTTHFQLPAGGEINVLVERTGYSPWTETIPPGNLSFVREVITSLSAISAENQIKTIDLLIKLLQKTEAVLNVINNQSIPIPSVSVSTTTTAITGGPSVDNQEEELALLRRILARMTAVREAFNQN